MKIKYDKEVDAIYIELGKGRAQKTVKKSSDIFVDYDKKGNALGIEILNYSKTDNSKEHFQVSAGNKRIPIPA